MDKKLYTILVVDDEEFLCDAVAFELELNGMNAIKAHSGEEAWEIFQKEKIDLILSDVRMPNGDGVEFLEKIRKKDKIKPVVFFITGFKDITDEEAFERGVNKILHKPVESSELIKAVRDSLNLR